MRPQILRARHDERKAAEQRDNKYDENNDRDCQAHSGILPAAHLMQT
jgi:hypothetical protein